MEKRFNWWFFFLSYLHTSLCNEFFPKPKKKVFIAEFSCLALLLLHLHRVRKVTNNRPSSSSSTSNSQCTHHPHRPTINSRTAIWWTTRCPRPSTANRFPKLVPTCRCPASRVRTREVTTHRRTQRHRTSLRWVQSDRFNHFVSVLLTH